LNEEVENHEDRTRASVADAKRTLQACFGNPRLVPLQQLARVFEGRSDPGTFLC
jgi:hypothetical protein